jgi:Glycosyltransferase family 87
MRPTATTTRAYPLLAGGAVGGGACVNLAFAIWVLVTHPALNSDFRGPWSVAGFVRRHAALLYQAAPLRAFQQQIYPGFNSFFPYQYPPSFLLAIQWMGGWRFATALAIWTLAGLVALAASAVLFFRPGMRVFGILALLASPAALLNGAGGETGYFTTALLLAGFALLPARPCCAGIAFGLLTLKPQLGLLIPFAFLGRGDFRAFAAACFIALALIGLSCALFPSRLWLEWLRCLPVYQAQYLAAGKTLGLNAIVTLAGNLTALGLRPCVVWILQALAGLGGACAVFLAFRHSPYWRAVAVLFAGMFLCAPHAYAYDTLPLIAAMLLAEPESAGPVVLCLATWFAPYLLLTGAKYWFFYAIPETLLFYAIIRLAFSAGRRPNTEHEPVPSTELPPSQC